MISIVFLLGCSETVDIQMYKFDEAAWCFEAVTVAMPREDGWGEWADSQFWGRCHDDGPRYFAADDGSCWMIELYCPISDAEALRNEWASDNQSDHDYCSVHTGGQPICDAD